jgi:hypothetical protein
MSTDAIFRITTKYGPRNIGLLKIKANTRLVI